jgi:hypothetical protein
MTNDDYEYLEEQYDGLPSRGPIRKNTAPTGSLTDNARVIKSQRDGAIKRLREAKQSGYLR